MKGPTSTGVDVPAQALLSTLAVFFFLGCPAHSPMQVPPGEPAVVSTEEAGAPRTADPAPKLSARGGLRPDGAACFHSSHCASNVCEGASCDSSQPGACVPSDRVCAAEVVEYCGCDGKTFLASSSCPGEPFASPGACPEDAQSNAAGAEDDPAGGSEP